MSRKVDLHNDVKLPPTFKGVFINKAFESRRKCKERWFYLQGSDQNMYALCSDRNAYS